MAVLVIADHDGSTVRDTTHKTVTAALALSSDVDVLVVGQGAQAARGGDAVQPGHVDVQDHGDRPDFPNPFDGGQSIAGAVGCAPGQ